MKIRNKLRLLLLVLPLLTGACSDNDDSPQNHHPTDAEVKYAVTASADIISTVQYRLPTGDFADDDAAPADWAHTVTAQLPFNAAMFVQLSNATSLPQTYSMMIYVNDTLAQTKSGSVAAAASAGDELSLSLP